MSAIEKLATGVPGLEVVTHGGIPMTPSICQLTASRQCPSSVCRATQMLSHE